MISLNSRTAVLLALLTEPPRRTPITMKASLSAAAAVLPVLAAAAPSCPKVCSTKPAAFFLAGDSTTAVQSEGGGGWGNGFLSFLVPPATGANYGRNGRTTVDFVSGGH